MLNAAQLGSAPVYLEATQSEHSSTLAAPRLVTAAWPVQLGWVEMVAPFVDLLEGTVLQLAFVTDVYDLACDQGERFAALRVPPKRYDHGRPRYLSSNRRQAFDMASLRRQSATS